MPDDRPDPSEMQQLVDELAAIAPDIARAHKRLFDSFVEAGFDDAQALILTLATIHGPQAS